MDLSPLWIIPLHHTKRLFISSRSGSHPPQRTGFPLSIDIQFFAETSASQVKFHRLSLTLFTENV